jgi:Flp pilus assembly pilin Flp
MPRPILLIADIATGAEPPGSSNEPKETGMHTLARRVRNLLRREDGPTGAEYALVLVLIGVVAISAIGAVAGSGACTFAAKAKTGGAGPTGS